MRIFNPAIIFLIWACQCIMQHWLAHIGTIHTLQQGVTIAGRLGQAQHNIDVLAPFSQLLDAFVMQYSNLGKHYIYIYIYIYIQCNNSLIIAYIDKGYHCCVSLIDYKLLLRLMRNE